MATLRIYFIIPFHKTSVYVRQRDVWSQAVQEARERGQRVRELPCLLHVTRASSEGGSTFLRITLTHGDVCKPVGGAGVWDLGQAVGSCRGSVSSFISA